MRAVGRYILALSCLGVALGPVAAQVRILQQGQALDANFLVGSGGQNITRYQPPIDSQLFVTGQVSGLAGFRGSVAYYAPDQLNLTLPSAAVDAFRGQTVGVNDVITGTPYVTAPYYDRSSTLLGARGIVSGQALPGTDVPISAIPPAPQGLYGQAGTAAYNPLGLGSDRLGLVMPLAGSTLRPFLEQGLRGTATVPTLFTVPGAARREELEHELGGVVLPEDFAVQSEIDTRLDPTARNNRVDRLRPPTLAPEPNEPNAGLNVARLPLHPLGGTEAVPPQPDEDVFSDILSRLSRGGAGEGLIPPAERRAIWRAAEPNAPAPEKRKTEEKEGRKEETVERPAMLEIDRKALMETTARPGIVEYTPEGGLLIHRLAGTSRDQFNTLMAAGEENLKDGNYYDAAEIYRQAVSVDQNNPLARVGLSVALFAAGEPLGAADQLKRAAEMFPPILTSRLDLAAIVDKELLARRLDFLARRLDNPQTGPEPMLHFIAAYVYHNLGDEQQARDYAIKLRDSSPDDRVLARYAASLLGGATPASAPASRPVAESLATQPGGS